MNRPRAGLRDVAEAAGVSVGTVSHVLNHPEKVAPATVERVRTAIADLGYVRNAAASQLRSGRSRTIGAVVLDVGNPFFADVLRGADDAGVAHGYSFFSASSYADSSRQRRYLALFEQQRADGVLINPVGEPVRELHSLERSGARVVLVDAELSGFASVSVDDAEGGRLAVEHLVHTGRSRIAYVGGPPHIRQVAQRWEGAQEAAGARAELQRLTCESMTVLAGRAAGERILAMSPKERPDAVFCANDLLAVGLMQAIIVSDRIRIPDDLALIGYDDIDFAQAAIVALSSIRQPAVQMGQSAIGLMADPSAEPAQVRFEPELVVRDSTGWVSGSAAGR